MDPDATTTLLAALDQGHPLPDAAAAAGLPYPAPDRQRTPLTPAEDDLLKALLARHIGRGDMARLVGRSPAAVSLRLLGQPRTCRDCNAPLPAPTGRGRHPVRCTPCTTKHRTPTPKAAPGTGWDPDTTTALLYALDHGLNVTDAAAYACTPYPAPERHRHPFTPAEDDLYTALLARHVPRAHMAALTGRTAATVAHRLTGQPRTCTGCHTPLPQPGQGANTGPRRCPTCHSAPPTTRTCPECGTSFTTTHPGQVHCAPPCAKTAFYRHIHNTPHLAAAHTARAAAAHRTAKSTRLTKTCPACDTTFTTNAADNRTHCTRTCKRQAPQPVPHYNRAWTPADEHHLRTRYPTGEPIPDIAAALGRTPAAIRGRAGILGLKRPGRHHPTRRAA